MQALHMSVSQKQILKKYQQRPTRWRVDFQVRILLTKLIEYLID
jgi:hypothetical protein